MLIVINVRWTLVVVGAVCRERAGCVWCGGRIVRCAVTRVRTHHRAGVRCRADGRRAQWAARALALSASYDGSAHVRPEGGEGVPVGDVGVAEVGAWLGASVGVGVAAAAATRTHAHVT